MVKTSYTVTRFDVGYQGFYVEVTPTTFGGREMIEFILCNEEYGMKNSMVGFMKEDCPESEWEQIIMGELLQNGHISLYWDDIAAIETESDEEPDASCEAECDCDDCCGQCGNIYEAIDLHNAHIEDLQDLAEALIKQYPCIEETPVNDVFCKTFDSTKGVSIFLCCEANEFDDGEWMVTDDGYVVREDECECNGDCANCPMEQ